MHKKLTVLIHGGAGTIVGNSSDKIQYLDALRRIISEIYKFSSGNITTMLLSNFYTFDVMID
jgi:hypothetical protein